VGPEHGGMFVPSVDMVQQQQPAQQPPPPGAMTPQDEGAKKRKRRTQREKLETMTVTTRWACPRDPSRKDRGPGPMTSCRLCGGRGCPLVVYACNNKAEEFCFVVERNENGSSKFMCKDCGDTFLGTQSRIIAHKLQIPGRGVAVCMVPPSNEARAILEPIDVVGHKDVSQRKRASGEGKGKITKEKQKMQKETDMAVARFFYECDIPFQRAEEAAFKRMMRAVGDYGAGYCPPDRERIADNRPKADTGGESAKGKLPDKPPGLLWACMETLRREKEACLGSAMRTGVTLVSDGARNAKAGVVAYAAATPKGSVFVSVTDAAASGQAAAPTPEFLAADAEAAVRKVGEQNVFMVVMDGPFPCAQALQILQGSLPRVMTMRSAAWGWDAVLQDIGKRFRTEVLAPVHAILLHVTNHPVIYGVLEGLKGGRHLLEPAEARLSVDVVPVRAFLSDKTVIKHLWSHPAVSLWLDERGAGRQAVRDRHTALGLEHVHNGDWWRLVEAFVTLVNTAVPLVGEHDLDAPNLYKLPLMYDQACAALQQPLLHNGQETDAAGLVAGGARVAGRPGDGSVQAAVLEVLRESREALVSEVSLAAAMVYPPFVYQDPVPYEPQGGRAAFNAVAQRYFGASEDLHVATLTAFTQLRNRHGAFDPAVAKKLANTDVFVFYDNLCLEPEHKPLAELALKLLHSVGTLSASDRQTRDTPGLVGGFSMSGRSDQLIQMRMHWKLTQRGKDQASARQNNVLAPPNSHPCNWLHPKSSTRHHPH